MSLKRQRKAEMDKFKGNRDSEGEHWLSISDMMSGLMMLFLFISVLYVQRVNKELERVKEIAVTYNRLQNELYRDLSEEFKDDLPRWNAVIDRKTLSIRFGAPDVYFSAGSSELTPVFSKIMRDFWPRYITILTSVKYKDDIEEIRIEGHTSSEWRTDVPPDIAYLLNMELSQSRTRSVLSFALSITDSTHDLSWIRQRLTANGLSSSKLIVKDGSENKDLSRRVEFRVRTNAEQRIVRIIEETSK
jgi:outer membrane protein OmpA-like peptidoglycan-associated protein